MKFQLLACLCLFSSVLAAQDLQRAVLASGGGSYVVETPEATYYVSQTVGQKGVIGTIAQEGVRMRQGFQQPPLMIVSAPDDTVDLQARLYPNPVSYQLNVRFTNDLEGSVECFLYDTSGRQVMEQIYAANQEIRIDLSTLSSGLYVIHLVHKGSAFTSRIIKN